ncbi:MAG: indole-3-glycerol-phosphate synthase [Gemmatimonadaceae bacterium]
MPETQGITTSRRIWTPPSGTLGGLVAAAYARAAAQGREALHWNDLATTAAAGPSFRDALSRPAVAVIAEVKRRSPSKGIINPEIQAPAQARLYVEAGAAAISVLTESEHFGGSMADLEVVAATVAVPVLRKDFIVSTVQLYEARARGAAAALLIVRALPRGALVELHDVGSAIGLDLLVEVRDEVELATAIDIGARIIGVNNRDLETLVIDPSTVGRIVPLIPKDVVAVAESGMASPEHVRRAASAGADAVLVGSYVSAAADPLTAVRSLTGMQKERYARPD